MNVETIQDEMMTQACKYLRQEGRLADIQGDAFLRSLVLALQREAGDFGRLFEIARGQGLADETAAVMVARFLGIKAAMGVLRA